MSVGLSTKRAPSRSNSEGLWTAAATPLSNGSARTHELRSLGLLFAQGPGATPKQLHTGTLTLHEQGPDWKARAATGGAVEGTAMQVLRCPNVPRRERVALEAPEGAAGPARRPSLVVSLAGGQLPRTK